jgi:predicted DNA-binding protein with PD1-like motif
MVRALAQPGMVSRWSGIPKACHVACWCGLIADTVAKGSSAKEALVVGGGVAAYVGARIPATHDPSFFEVVRSSGFRAGFALHRKLFGAAVAPHPNGLRMKQKLENLWNRLVSRALIRLRVIERMPREQLMRSELASREDGRTFVLVLDEGEEAFAAVTDFANENAIKAASVTAIGGFAGARVGWFDLDARRYTPIAVDEQCEVLSLLGDIALGDDGKASLHLHAVLGLRDGSVRGGHFLAGKVQPTLEVTIIETASNLRRRKRPDLGIALIDI